MHLGLVPPIFHAGGELGSDQLDVLQNLTLSLMATKGATNQLSLKSKYTHYISTGSQDSVLKDAEFACSSMLVTFKLFESQTMPFV
jgi:hypothetical protein